MVTIALNGTTGFLGSGIINFLENKYNIIRINRDQYNLPPVALSSIIEGADYIINLAGTPISGLWTKAYCHEIFHSRIDTTANLVSSLNYLHKKPKLFISFSGVNIYDSFHRHTEASCFFSTSFLAQVCKAWEREALKSVNYQVPCTIVRLGIVLDKNGGFLNKMSLTHNFKFILQFGSDAQTFSFIALIDFLRAIEFIIENNSTGIYNFTTPYPATYFDFSQTYKKINKMWLRVKVPDFILKLLPNGMEEIFLSGQEVIPDALLNDGFNFECDNLTKSINFKEGTH